MKRKGPSRRAELIALFQQRYLAEKGEPLAYKDAKRIIRYALSPNVERLLIATGEALERSRESPQMCARIHRKLTDDLNAIYREAML